MKEAEDDIKNAFERHAQTIIAGVMLALLCWVGVTLLDVRDRLAKIETRQLSMPDRDRYIDNELAELRKRVRDMELESARRDKK